MTELVQNWHVDRDDEVSVLRYDGGERRTLGIDGAGMLAELLAERAARPAPPVVVLVLDVLHAELDEVLEMAAGRPIAEWAPWLAAISGLEGYPSATIAAVPVQRRVGAASWRSAPTSVWRRPMPAWVCSKPGSASSPVPGAPSACPA